MDERKAYWFEQPYMPRMKNIAVASVILEDGRLSFCVPGDDGLPWSRGVEPDWKGCFGRG